MVVAVDRRSPTPTPTSCRTTRRTTATWAPSGCSSSSAARATSSTCAASPASRPTPTATRASSAPSPRTPASTSSARRSPTGRRPRHRADHRPAQRGHAHRRRLDVGHRQRHRRRVQDGRCALSCRSSARTTSASLRSCWTDNYPGLIGAAVTNPASVGGAGVALALQILDGKAPADKTVLLTPPVWDNVTDDGKAALAAATDPSLDPTTGPWACRSRTGRPTPRTSSWPARARASSHPTVAVSRGAGSAGTPRTIPQPHP